MQLGKTLVGAIIGGALGISALIAIYFATQIDQAWLAIVVAVLTGLGVRWMVSTKGHASYARGGLTAILALVAFVVGTMLVAELATRQAAAAAKKPVPKASADQPAEEAREDDAGEAESAPPPADMPVDRTAMTGTPRPGNPNRGSSPMDYIWLAVAGLVAYELGRGSGTSQKSVEERAAEDDHETVAPGNEP